MALAVLLLSALPALAVDKVWLGGSANWGTAGNWNPAGAPGVNDRARITTAGVAPILSASTTINRLEVQTSATLTIATGITLTLNATASPIIDGSGTVVTAGSGRIRVIGGNNFRVINSSMTLGNFSLESSNAGWVFATSAGITVTFTGTLTVTAGRLAFGVAPAGAPVTVDINGNLALSGGVLELRSPASILRLSGNWVQTGAWIAGVNSTVVLDGAVAQFIDIERAAVAEFDFEHLTIANTSGLVTYQDNSLAALPNGFNILGNLTLLAGARLTVLDSAVIGDAAADVFGIGPGAQATFAAQMDCDGSLTFVAGGGNTLRLEGPLIADATVLGNPFTPGTGTVTYGGAAVNHTVYTQSNGVQINYHHLEIDTSGGMTATQEAAGLLRVNGNFTVLGAPSVFTSAAGSMNVAGSFISNGTFNHASATVTMDGTGSIAGTSVALLFNNLLVNGLTTSVVTAARSFSTAATFQVQQGTLSTTGLLTPIVMTALSGVSIGNGGAAGTAQLSLLGPATLAVQPGFAFSVNANDGLFRANSEVSGTPTLTRAGAAGVFDAVVSGQVDVRRLNFSFGDLEGLEIAATATIANLRGIAFTGPNATVNARFLTIRSPGISLDCPGCTFVALPPGTFNVWAQDTASANGIPVRIRLENRGAAPLAGGGGAGAGEGALPADNWDADDDLNRNGVLDGIETVSANHGGAIVQWVYTANVNLTGQIRGFPMPAFDWNTFVYYSTYVLARDSLGTGEDRIYVLNSEGDLKPYSFTLTGIGAGDIVGPLFWNSEGAEHAVYFGTSTGRVYRLLDTGTNLVPPSSGPWMTPFLDAQQFDEVTSAIISDGVNLYFGGRKGGLEGLLKLSISTKAVVGGHLSTINQRVGTAPSYADGATTKYLYCGTTIGGSTSHLYRIHVNNWVIDADFRNSSFTGDANDMTSDVVAYVNVPVDTLYAGEVNGRMHALPALGTVAQFVTPRTGYPFRDAASSAIRGGAYRQTFPVARLVYGDSGGRLYTLNGTLPATPVLNTDYFRLSTGASPIETMPLSQSGVIYASNRTGQLFVVDARTGVSPAQSILLTWNFGTAALSDVSRDFSTSRIYVGTSGGRLYSVPESADPTPLFP